MDKSTELECMELPCGWHWILLEGNFTRSTAKVTCYQMEADDDSGNVHCVDR